MSGDSAGIVAALRSHPGCLAWFLGLLLFGGLGGVLFWSLLPATSTPAGDGAPSPVAPSGAPSTGPPRAAPVTVILAGTADGLELLHDAGASAELAYRQESLAASGINLRTMVSGGYGTDDATRMTFYGGDLAAHWPEPALGDSAKATLDTVFATNFPNLQPDGDIAEYDAGPQGGHLWCRTYAYGVRSAAEHWVACGWLDEWTLGYGFGKADSEAAAAALLVAMRADLEVPVVP